MIRDGGICQCYVRRVETERAGREGVGVGWGAGDRGYLQLDGADGETGCFSCGNITAKAEDRYYAAAKDYVRYYATAKGYVKSECTQRSVCLSGGGAHNACFMMIGEFP